MDLKNRPSTTARSKEVKSAPTINTKSAKAASTTTTKKAAQASSSKTSKQAPSQSAAEVPKKKSIQPPVRAAGPKGPSKPAPADAVSVLMSRLSQY